MAFIRDVLVRIGKRIVCHRRLKQKREKWK